MMPSVSLIIPTTGERPSLVAALRSALAQDMPGLEIVLVDDARTAAWTSSPAFAPLLADPRVRVARSGRRAGCAAAKNVGLAAARGEWVCYLDDDNEYRAGKVRAQHALALATGSPVVLCGIEYRAAGRVRINQVETTRFSGDDLLLRALADTNVLFHRRETSCRWDEELGTADDACFFQSILALEKGEVIVPNVAEPLVIYHSHAGLRANREAISHYRGQRRLLVRWSRRYSPVARRIQVCRQMLSADKFESSHWCRLAEHAVMLLRVGGWREWRVVINAIGVKLPLVRRWMVS
jgi:glycosyltransferase involved in cell wall biosynthesis